MTEQEFKDIVSLLKTYEPEKMHRTMISIESILQDLYVEKVNLSNDMRRSILYYQLSFDIKKKRIEYIDEIILPKESKSLFLQSDIIFPESKIIALSRVKSFRRERQRILKVTGDYLLRVKQNARILSEVYREIRNLENQLQLLRLAEDVRIFFIHRLIDVSSIIDEDISRIYSIYQKGG